MSQAHNVFIRTPAIPFTYHPLSENLELAHFVDTNIVFSNKLNRPIDMGDIAVAYGNAPIAKQKYELIGGKYISFKDKNGQSREYYFPRDSAKLHELFSDQPDISSWLEDSSTSVRKIIQLRPRIVVYLTTNRDDKIIIDGRFDDMDKIENDYLIEKGLKLFSRDLHEVSLLHAFILNNTTVKTRPSTPTFIAAKRIEDAIHINSKLQEQVTEFKASMTTPVHHAISPPMSLDPLRQIRLRYQSIDYTYTAQQIGAFFEVLETVAKLEPETIQSIRDAIFQKRMAEIPTGILVTYDKAMNKSSVFL